MPTQPTPPSPEGHSPWRIVLIIALLLIALMAGCAVMTGFMASKAVKTAMENGGIRVDEEDGTLTFSNEDGDVTMTTSGEGDEPVELPANFPSDFPIPADMTPVHAATFTEEGETAYMVAWKTDRPIQEIEADYRAKLTQAGWAESFANMTENGGMMVYTRGEGTPEETGAWISLDTEDGSTMVQLMLGGSDDIE